MIDEDEKFLEKKIIFFNKLFRSYFLIFAQ